MGKSLRDQLVARGLVSAFEAALEDDLARRRLNRTCFRNALVGAGRVDRDHHAVVIEYRRHREAAK